MPDQLAPWPPPHRRHRRAPPVMSSDQRTRFTAAELLAEPFPEPSWVVPGLLPQGLTLLLGAPALGKTALALSFALTASGGEPSLGTASAAPGAVLYVALEDSPSHLQSRLQTMLRGGAPPTALEFWTDCPTLDAGGLRGLAAWAAQRPNPRLIVVDTVAGVTPPAFARLLPEDRDGATLAAFALLARRLRVALLVLHHLRLGRREAIARVLSGRSHLSRAVDAVLVLEQSRGDQPAVLHVGGPGVPASRHALAWDRAARTWVVPGPAPAAPLSVTRQVIVAALRAAPAPLRPRDIAAATGLNPVTVRGHLRKMARAGQIRVAGPGRYAPIDAS